MKTTAAAAAAAAAPTNFHHSRPTNPSIKPANWPQPNPNFLNFPPKSNPIPLFLTHCSTKPNTNNNAATDQNQPTTNPPPNPRTQPQALPNSTPQLPSNPSFSKGLIFHLGLNNSWDGLEIGSPVVKRYLGDEQERWYMWYHGRGSEKPDSDSIGLAISSNGVHWERGTAGVRSNADVGIVMGRSKDWWAFDTDGVRPSEIVIMSSNKIRANSAVYWLYYTGFCSEKIDSLDGSLDVDRKLLPGLAMSQDGRHWARIEGEHHSGALLDVGSDGEWDSLFLASPQVVFHGKGDLRMYYHSFDVGMGTFAVGIARSRDGMRWVKLGEIVLEGPIGGTEFDEKGMVNPRVVRDRKSGEYLMVYEGVGAGGERSIGMAVSSDGLKDWRRVGSGSVFERSGDGGWDCGGVGFPCLVQMDGETEEWRLYYRGVGEDGRTGIGLAVSQGSGGIDFRRWSGFVV